MGLSPALRKYPANRGASKCIFSGPLQSDGVRVDQRVVKICFTADDIHTKIEAAVWNSPVRAAFQRWVDEDKAPEDQWRSRATKLVRIMTGDDYVDPSIVEWIIRKKPRR